MILFFILSLLATSFVILANCFYLEQNNKRIFASSDFISNKNQDPWVCNFIPGSLRNFIDANIFYTRLKKEKLYKEITFSSVAFLILIIFFIFLSKFYLLAFALIVLFVVPIDFFLKINAGKKSFYESFDHLAICLEILTVKAETPLTNALKIISDSLPDEFFVARNELELLLQKAEKLGMDKVLVELDKDDGSEQEFLSLLSAVQKGTKKQALKKNFSDFIARQKLIKDERRKMHIENMQLYLLVPVMIMLIIAMLPLIDMTMSQLGKGLGGLG